MAEPLVQLLNAGDLGHVMQQQEDLQATIVLSALEGLGQAAKTGYIRAALQAKAEITQELVGDLLNQLHITPDSKAMDDIQQRLFQFPGTFGGDAAMKADGDFSPSEL